MKKINVFLLLCMVLIYVSTMTSCDWLMDLIFPTEEEYGITLEVIGIDSIKITLEAVENAANYFIQRASLANGDYTEIYRSADNTFTDTGLTDDTDYYYKAGAILNDGTSVYYNSGVPVSATTERAFGAPRDVIANLINEGATYYVSLTWEAVSNASYYKISYSNTYSNDSTFFDNDNNFIGIVFDSPVTNNFVQITDEVAFLESTRYYFFVQAIYDSTVSGYSQDKAFVDTPGEAKPPAKVLATVTQENQVKLEWEVGVNAERYWIYRSTVETGTYSKIDEKANIVDPETKYVMYIDTTVSQNVTYFYKIVSINTTYGPDDEAYIIQYVLDSVKAVRVNSALPAPSGFNVLFDNSSGVLLSWNAVNGATSYNIYRSLYYGTEYSLLENTTSISHTDNNNIKAGLTYYYKVTAIGESAEIESAFSEIRSIYIEAIINPPTNLSGTALSDTKVNLSWNAPKGISATLYYDVEIKEGISWNSVITDRPENSCTVASLSPATSYSFRVRAKDGSGNFSNYSNIFILTTLPQTPQLSVQSKGADYIVLEWSLSPGAMGYNMYMATSPTGAYNKLNQTVITAGSYNVPNLTRGATYYFKITSVTSQGNEAQLDVLNGFAVTTISLDTPNVTSVTASGINITVTWQAVVGATKYSVQWSTSPLSGWTDATPAEGTTDTSYTFSATGAVSGTYIYVKVKALNDSDQESEWSDGNDSVIID